MKLNLGCGSDYKKGWINVDVVKGTADVVWDLNRFPYPFKDNSADYVLLKHVLEHLDDIILVMNELHRIVKRGGIVEIRVPFYTNFQALTHVQHKHFFAYGTLDLVTEKSATKYTDKLWKYIERKLIFHKGILVQKLRLDIFYPLRKCFSFLANKLVFSSITDKIYTS